MDHSKKVRGTHGVWDSVVAGLVRWREEGNINILALSGKCWPRCVAGSGWGRHSGKEHFGGIEVGGGHRCRGRTVPTPRLGDPWPSVPIPGTHSPFTFTRHAGLTSHVGTTRSRETTILTSKSVLCSDTGVFFNSHSDVLFACFLEPLFPSRTPV